MLHLVGRLGQDLAGSGPSADAGLLSILDRLVEHGAIADDDGGYSLTEAGEDRLKLADAEVESSISLYDIFGDVAHHGDRIELGGGMGADLRVDVYEAEGSTPPKQSCNVSSTKGRWTTSKATGGRRFSTTSSSSSS